MKVQKPLNTFVIEDYFFTKDKECEASQQRSVTILNEEQLCPPEVAFSDLIIQRDYHICQDLKYPNFVPYFKKRFSAQDAGLFMNTNLFFDIDDLLDAQKKMQKFV